MWLRAIKAKRNGARVYHVNADDAAKTIAALPADARVAIVWDGVDLDLGRALIDASSGRNVATYIASEQPNARGAEAMGMLPIDGGMDGAMMFDAARNGKLGVLALFGVNPVRNAADPQAVRAALARSQNAFAGTFGDALYHSGASRRPDAHELEPRTLWDGGGTAAHDERVVALLRETVDV